MTAPLSVARLPPRRRRRLGLVVLVVLFALLLLLSNLVPLAAEWLWFQALGYQRVFTTRLVTEAVLGVGVGGLVFAFLYVNLRIAQRGLVPNPVVVQYSFGATAVDVTRLLRRLALPTALGLALLFGLGAAGGWLGVLQFLHRTPFGVTGVPRPASGTVVLHHRTARGGELRRAPRPAHRPAARRARGRGGRSAGPMGSQEPASGPQHRARGRALPRRVAARRRSLPGADPKT